MSDKNRSNLSREFSRPSVSELKTRLEKNLKRWIPGNNVLVSRELDIFDDIVSSRRNFLKMFGMAGLAILVEHGCGTPSQWSAGDEALPPVNTTTVTGLANIHANADVFDTMVTQSDLDPVSTSNYEAVLESFNSLFKADETNDEQNSDGPYSPFQKTYGQPEIVHLSNNDAEPKQKITINQYSPSGAGLNETLVGQLTPLKPSSIKFNKVVATCSGDHNSMSSGNLINHKVIAAAAVNSDRNFKNWYTDAPIKSNDDFVNQLVVFHQFSAKKPPAPGEKAPGVWTDGWKSFLPLQAFRYQYQFLYQVDQQYGYVPQRRTNDYSWASYRMTVQDLRTHTDANNNRYIYGTLKVDYFHLYCFVIDCNTLDSNGNPPVFFFTPKELHKESTQLLGCAYNQSLWGTYSNPENLSEHIPEKLIEMELYNQNFEFIAATNPATSKTSFLLFYGSLNTTDVTGAPIDDCAKNNVHYVLDVVPDYKSQRIKFIGSMYGFAPNTPWIFNNRTNMVLPESAGIMGESYGPVN